MCVKSGTCMLTVCKIWKRYWINYIKMTSKVSIIMYLSIGLHEDRLRGIKVFCELAENGVWVGCQSGSAQDFKHLPSHIEFDSVRACGPELRPIFKQTFFLSFHLLAETKKLRLECDDNAETTWLGMLCCMHCNAIRRSSQLGVLQIGCVCMIVIP